MAGLPFNVTRRELIGGAAAATLPLQAGFAAPPSMKVVLLGTKGGPTPSAFRAPASVAISIDGFVYLVDCPNGVAGQLVKAGYRLNQLSNVFVTHNHSDHVLDAGNLMVLAWGSGLKERVTLHGPSPLKEIVSRSLAASSYDTAVRMREEGRPPLNPLIKVHEIGAAGVIFQDARVKVTSALVDHFTVKPALAFRFDTARRSVVISGDTTYSEKLVQLAMGADLLIHEAMYLPGVDQLADGNARLKEHLLRSHSTTEQVGMVAERSGVKKLVLSHLVPAFPSISDEMWLRGVRKSFKGEAVVGRDLQEV
jgi:ribonuclease BN (tRNA processing enzyme)